MGKGVSDEEEVPELPIDELVACVNRMKARLEEGLPIVKADARRVLEITDNHIERTGRIPPPQVQAVIEKLRRTLEQT